MAYKVLFFNSQSLYGFFTDFNDISVAENAVGWFRSLHYNNVAEVFINFPGVSQDKTKSKK